MAENEQPEAAPSPGGMKTLIGMVMAAAFMGAVIVVECAVAYLWFPSAEEVVALAEKKLEERRPSSQDPVDLLSPEGEAVPMTEQDLGNYSVTAFQPTSNTTLRIDFHLFGSIIDEDADEFQKLFTRSEHRFREQVIVTVRNSEITDLTDPGLGLIKRKILEKTNRLLGKALLQSVVFSEFSFVEQ